jgi:hypothetical protein
MRTRTPPDRASDRSRHRASEFRSIREKATTSTDAEGTRHRRSRHQPPERCSDRALAGKSTESSTCDTSAPSPRRVTSAPRSPLRVKLQTLSPHPVMADAATIAALSSAAWLIPEAQKLQVGRAGSAAVDATAAAATQLLRHRPLKADRAELQGPQAVLTAHTCFLLKSVVRGACAGFT